MIATNIQLVYVKDACMILAYVLFLLSTLCYGCACVCVYSTCVCMCKSIVAPEIVGVYGLICLFSKQNLRLKILNLYL